MTLTPGPRTSTDAEVPRLPDPVRRRLVATASAVHAAGLKSFGLLLAAPDHPDFPFTASDVVFFDPRRNRRNDPATRAAFEAQGEYFRSYDDAGFVADPAGGAGAHRRQPANFSVIDFRLHDPAMPWHLIISLRDPENPVLRAFAVRKDPTDFGIDPDDGAEHSEQPYTGPEVTSLQLAGPEVPTAAVA